MSMFDYYQPKAELRCPVCLRVLREWQGKDGANGLFVWVEGTPFPINQLVDEEIRVERERRQQLSLPPRFVIYSYDCPDHRPIEAECAAPAGVWSETTVRPFEEG
jgi:hypothetical protein